MQITKKIKKTLKIFGFIFTFFIGVLFGVFLNIPYFSVDGKINIIDALSLVCTILLAIYITKVLEKSKEDKRNEKDLILIRTDDIFQIITTISSKISPSGINYNEITALLKRLSMSIQVIYNVLNLISIEIDPKSKALINDSVRKIRDLLTDTPVESEIPPLVLFSPIRITNNNILLSTLRITEIEVDKLKQNLLLLQISINNG